MPAVDHVDLVVSSLAVSLPFYRGLLEPLGWHENQIVGERGEAVHYIGKDGHALGLREAQSDAHPLPYERYAVGVHHVCLGVDSREAVDERAAWLRSGGATIESGPREYDYSPGYYAVFFYDPDGLKLELVHTP